MYEVDEDVRAKLLLANLSERARALTMRLTKEQLNDYKFLKEFLLREFKISPSNLRARIFYDLFIQIACCSYVLSEKQKDN